MEALHQRLNYLEAKLKTINPNEERLLTGLEVQKFYNISKPTQIEWVKKGFLVPVTLGTGRRKYFRYADLKQRS